MKNLFLLQPKPARFSFSGPTQRLYLSLPFFPFLPAQPNPAGPIPSPRPSSRPPPLCRRQVGPTCRGRLLPPMRGSDSSQSPATPRLAARRLGAHAKDSLGPYLSAALPPWAPSELQPPPPPQTLVREPPLSSSELRVAPPFRRFPSMFSPPEGSRRGEDALCFLIPPYLVLSPAQPLAGAPPPLVDVVSPVPLAKAPRGPPSRVRRRACSLSVQNPSRAEPGRPSLANSGDPPPPRLAAGRPAPPPARPIQS